MIGLLQEMRIEKAVLVGHDWGAALTWLLGRLYPSYFPVIAALSVPTSLRKHGSPSSVELCRKIFGAGEDRLFWYQAYHQETFPGTHDHGPAEAEYDANVYESILRMWTDKTVPRAAVPGPSVSNLRRDGGMFAHSGGGLPLQLPTWLSESDLEYAVEQFKHHGFRGGVNYYRNIDRNHRMTPHLAGHVVQQPCLFLTGEDDPVVRFGPGGIDGQRARMAAACADLRGFVVLRCEDEDGKRTAGHWIQQERAAEVNSHLLAFLRETADVFANAPGVSTTPACARL
jgi:pimeloyl-ACP methyl ester carboxylesterase